MQVSDIGWIPHIIYRYLLGTMIQLKDMWGPINFLQCQCIPAAGVKGSCTPK